MASKTKSENCVEDDEGNMNDYYYGYDSCEVTVLSLADIETDPDPAVVAVGEYVDFEAVIEPEGEGFRFVWSAPDGNPSYQSSGIYFSTYWTQPGYYTVTAASGFGELEVYATVVGVDRIQYQIESDYYQDCPNPLVAAKGASAIFISHKYYKENQLRF